MKYSVINPDSSEKLSFVIPTSVLFSPRKKRTQNSALFFCKSITYKGF